MVGFSRLYCSIFATTVGVATFGLLPPMIPGGLRDPVVEKNVVKKLNYKYNLFLSSITQSFSLLKNS